MSSTAGIVGPRVSSGWTRLWVGAAVVGGIVGSFFVFNGSVPGMGFFEAKSPPAPTYELRVNSTPTQLDRPTQPTFAPPAPKPQEEPRRQSGWTEEQKKALNSSIGFLGSTAAAVPANARTDRQRTGGGDDEGDALTKSLTPTKLEGTSAVEMGNPRWMIAQGRLIHCQQAWRVSSTIPGEVKAVLDEPVWGDTNDVILLPKGSTAMGVIRQAIMNGADRMSIMWMNITTPVLYDRHDMPHRYRIGVDSPFASELGETGADGDVNHHWARKILPIIGASILQTGGQYLVARAQQSQTSNTSINLGNVDGGVQAAIGELLRQQIMIPDVMTRNQGTACAIQIVRDLSIDGPYKLFLLDKYGR